MGVTLDDLKPVANSVPQAEKKIYTLDDLSEAGSTESTPDNSLMRDASERMGGYSLERGGLNLLQAKALLSGDTNAVVDYQKQLNDTDVPVNTPLGQDRMKLYDPNTAWYEKIMPFLRNIPSTFGESQAGSMAALATGATGAAAGSAIPGPGTLAGFMAGTGAGSFTVDFASGVRDYLVQQGVDMNDPEQVQAALDNAQLMHDAKVSAAKHAVPVGAMDALSAGLAGSTIHGAEAIAKMGAKAFAKTAGKEMGIQAAADVVGEGGGQIAQSGEITDPVGVLYEGALGGVTDIPEIGFGAYIRRNGPLNTEVKPAESDSQNLSEEELKALNGDATTVPASVEDTSQKLLPYYPEARKANPPDVIIPPAPPKTEGPKLLTDQRYTVAAEKTPKNQMASGFNKTVGQEPVLDIMPVSKDDLFLAAQQQNTTMPAFLNQDGGDVFTQAMDHEGKPIGTIARFTDKTVTFRTGRRVPWSKIGSLFVDNRPVDTRIPVTKDDFLAAVKAYDGEMPTFLNSRNEDRMVEAADAAGKKLGKILDYNLKQVKTEKGGWLSWKKVPNLFVDDTRAREKAPKVSSKPKPAVADALGGTKELPKFKAIPKARVLGNTNKAVTPTVITPPASNRFLMLPPPAKTTEEAANPSNPASTDSAPVEQSSAEIQDQAKALSQPDAKAITPVTHEVTFKAEIPTAKIDLAQRALDKVLGEGRVLAKAVSGLQNGTSALRGAQVNNLVFLSMDILNAPDHLSETAYHEAYEFLRGNNLLETKDIKIIESSRPLFKKAIAGKLGVDESAFDVLTSDEQGQQELEALAFGLYASGQLPNIGKATGVFSRIKNTLRRMGNMLKGMGFRTIDDVMDAISAGKYRDSRINNISNNVRFQAARIFDKVNPIVSDRYIADITDNDIRTYDIGDLAAKAEASTKPLAEGAVQSGFRAIANAATFFNSMPELARRIPVVSSIFHMFKSKEETRLTFMKHFAGKFNDLRQNREGFKSATAILDHMCNTDQSLTFTKEGNLVYKDAKGELKKASTATSQIAAGLHELFKGVPELFERQLRMELPNKDLDLNENSTPEEIRSMITALQEKASMMSGNGPKSAAIKVKIQSLEDIAKTLERIDELKRSPKAYLPRVRFGSWGIAVQTPKQDNLEDKARGPHPKGEPSWDTTGLYTVESGIDGLPSKKDIAEIKARIEKDFAGKQYRIPMINGREHFKLTFNTLTNKLGADSLVTAELISGLLGSISEGPYAEILHEQLNSFKDATRTRGYAKHLLERKNIKGYDNDFERSIGQYLVASSNALTNFRFNEAETQVKKTLLGLGENARSLGLDDKTLQLLQKYMEYNTSPSREFGQIRALNYVWAMGGNISSAVLQYATSLINLPAYAIQYGYTPLYTYYVTLKNLARTSNFMRYRKMRMGSSWEDMKHSVKFTPDEARFMEYAWNKGDIQANAAEDYLQDNPETRSVSNKLWSKAQELLGSAMQVAEHHSRATTALTLYNLLSSPSRVEYTLSQFAKDNNFQEFVRTNPELTSREALALYGVQENHGVYGKVGRSNAERQQWATIAFPFMTYPLQQFELLQNLMLKRGAHGKLAAIYTLLIFAFAGGALGAIPGSEALKQLYNYYMRNISGKDGADAELDFRTFIKESGIAPGYEKLLTQGWLNSTTGTNISSRIMPSMPFIDTAAKWLTASKATDTLGVVGSTINAVSQAQDINATGGDTFDILAQMMPASGLRNLFQGYDWNREGVQTMHGNMVATPEEISISDVLEKAAGFTPEYIAERRKDRYFGNLQNVQGQTAKTRLARRYADVMYDISRTTDPEDRKALEDERINILDEVFELRKFIQSHNGDAGDSWMSGFHSSVKKRLAQKRDPMSDVHRKKGIQYITNKSLDEHFSSPSDDSEED